MTTPGLVLPLGDLGGHLVLVWWLCRELDA
jgi:hypothetical protein